MSALSFAAFCAELALGYAMSHPAPFFVGLGVLGAGGVFGLAARIMARDDMPLSLRDQETERVFAAMTAELHHELPVAPAPVLVQHAEARHARPGVWRRLGGRVGLWWRARHALAPTPQDIEARIAVLREHAHRYAPQAALSAATTRLALLPAPTTGDGPAPVRAVTTKPLGVPYRAGVEAGAYQVARDPRSGQRVTSRNEPGPGSEPSGAAGPAPAAAPGAVMRPPEPSAVHHMDRIPPSAAPGPTDGQRVGTAVMRSGDPVTLPGVAGQVQVRDGSPRDASGALSGDERDAHFTTVRQPHVPGRAPATAHTPGPPTSPAREGSGTGPAGDLDYADAEPFSRWESDTFVGAAIGREGT